MKKNERITVPGSHTLLPVVSQILQMFGGKAKVDRVAYSVMARYDLPLKMFKKAKNEVNWAAVYLRKMGFLKGDSKRGEWELSPQYMDMEFEELKEVSYRLYSEQPWKDNI